MEKIRLEAALKWAKKNAVRREENRYGKRTNGEIGTILRNVVRVAVRRGSGPRAEVLSGCTVPELRTRLESLFQPEMSWDNFDLWEIDHIVPVSEFDLSSDMERKLCFHWSNLQPLWPEQNDDKGIALSRLPANLKVLQITPELRRSLKDARARRIAQV